MCSPMRPGVSRGSGLLVSLCILNFSDATGAEELKLNPPNFLFSSFSQGTGIMAEGDWDIEGNLYGMKTQSSGLDVPESSGIGLQSGQVSVRRQLSGLPGLDLGLAAGGSYLSQGTISGDVPSRGVSTFVTAHYAAKIVGALGAGAYGQFGGSAQRTGRNSWTETPIAAITPVLAWEPEGGIIGSIVLNPFVASYTETGELSQGPTLRHLVGAGASVGLGVNITEQLVLAPELSWVSSHGTEMQSGAQSARSDTYRIGVVETFSYRCSNSYLPTNSFSLGIWYFEEDGRVVGPASPGAASGSFKTRGALLGITFGLRKPSPGP